MRHARRMGWWLAVPVGLALGLALALALDRAAEPAAGQSGRSGVRVSAEQLKINQRISQAAVKRSNRANTRLDQLKLPATGPPGPPGPAGSAGPAGPGAVRVAFSGPVGTPVRRVLDLAGVAINAGCEAGAGGETTLAISFELAQAATFIGSVDRAAGTDPDDPTLEETDNFEVPLPAGPVPVGGPSAPDGEFVREFATVLFVLPTRTVSLNLSLIADGIADRCSFNGVAVPA